VYNASSVCRGTRCKVQVIVNVSFSAFLNRLSDLATDSDFTIVDYRFAHPGYFDPSLIIIAANGNPGFENMFGPDFLISEVPEPSTLALIGLGAAAMILRRRF
jgi:hypothetical protein